MAYSPERLERAQQLFDRTMGEFCMLPHLDGPYHLRQRASKRAAVIASWHDNDEDEDYSPSSKQTPTKRKLSLLHDSDQDIKPDKKAKSLSPTSTFRSRLSPDTEREASVPPSTPSHSEPDSWDRYWAVNPEIDTSDSRYSLRRRNKESASESPQKTDTQVEAETSNPTGDVPAEDQPPIRGCAACQELGMECSLASDPNPFAYPCTTCEIDDVFCVVSPPPIWKRSCENCKGRKKDTCSYRYADYDHSQPCLSCRNHGFECIAGPARCPPFALFSTSEPSEPSSPPKVDSPATSNSPHGTPELDVSEGSKAIEQTSSPKIDSPESFNLPHGTQQAEVSEVSKPSEQVSSPAIESNVQLPESNPAKNDSWEPSSPFCNAQPPVVQVPKPHEVIEIFDSDDDSPNIPERQPSPIYISDSLESPNQDTVSNAIALQSTNTQRIWTELVHPVQFLADDGEGFPPCNWCNNFAFGINGLGPRYPEVLIFGDGTIVELQDGHTAEGKEQSRMCISCTLNRFKIIRCSHDTLDLQTVPTPVKENLRADALRLLNEANEVLIDPETGKAGPFHPFTTYQWCSLCREPAFGTCQAIQPVDVYADVVNCDEESRGCGLMLCESCLHLTNEFQGDLNAVIAWGRNGPSPVSYRADVEFLLSGAENNNMYRRYMVAP
jgi:hypothetical protein